MVAIANYRNGITLKFHVLKYMLSVLFLITFHLTSTVCQETPVSDTLNIDSLIFQGNKQNIINETINTPQDIVVSSQHVEPLVETKKIPAKAALYSLILPGLGQTYNGNYWKVPIIYSLFAGMYFLCEENNYKYNAFKQAYKNSLNDLPVGPNFEQYTQSTLLQRKDYYKRQRDFNIILGVLIYALNILDANVDAHLMDYDISPDLSLNVKPEINNFLGVQNQKAKNSFGLKFVLSLR